MSYATEEMIWAHLAEVQRQARRSTWERSLAADARRPAPIVLALHLSLRARRAPDRDVPEHGAAAAPATVPARDPRACGEIGRAHV